MKRSTEEKEHHHRSIARMRRWAEEGRISDSVVERVEEALAGKLITRQEHEEMRANSYERDVLLAFLDNEAFLAAFAYTRSNCSQSDRRPHTTYDQALAGQYGEEAELRLRALMKRGAHE